MCPCGREWHSYEVPGRNRAHTTLLGEDGIDTNTLGEKRNHTSMLGEKLADTAPVCAALACARGTFLRPRHLGVAFGFLNPPFQGPAGCFVPCGREVRPYDCVSRPKASYELSFRPQERQERADGRKRSTRLLH